MTPNDGEPPQARRGTDDPVPEGWARRRPGGSDTDATTVASSAAPEADVGEHGPGPSRAPRQYFVPADAGGPAPEAREPSPGGAPPGRRVPGPGTAAPGAPRPRTRTRWTKRRIALVVVVAILGLLLAFVLYGLWQFNRIERVAVGDALTPTGGSGTNYLIVGSDSREGFDPNAPNAGAVLGEGADGSGQRSDTMLVLRVTGDGALMTSVPRDLWVTRADGTQGRINAAYREGPAALVDSIEQGIGIPIHHYMEVDFVTFAGLVDAVGGVTIDFAHPARDGRSGLVVDTAGPVTLDGIQALAYVRARHYEELVDGAWVGDPTGDLGRVQRQQQFLRAVMGEVGGTRNPIELMRVSSAVADGLRIDDTMGFTEALSFARRLRGLDPESVELPTTPFTTSGGAAVLDLVRPDADAVIARFDG